MVDDSCNRMVKTLIEYATITQRVAAIVAEQFKTAQDERPSLSTLLGIAGGIQNAVAAQIGQELQVALNEHFASQAQASGAQKLSLAKAINDQLDQLGLAILDPAFGVPCRLAVEHTPDGRGAFRLVTFGADALPVSEPFDHGRRLDFVPSPDKTRPFVSNVTRRLAGVGPVGAYRP